MSSSTGETIPWQTSDEQVGGFAYCDGLVKSGAPPRKTVKGFVYMQGRRPQSKQFNSLDPSWQSALVTIESHLEEARATIRQNRRTFHFRDPFGESCRALNASWIAKVNLELRNTGFYVDCVPVAVLGSNRQVGSSSRIHYIFIRVISTAKETANDSSPSSSWGNSIEAHERKAGLHKKKPVKTTLQRKDFGRNADDDDTTWEGNGTIDGEIKRGKLTFKNTAGREPYVPPFAARSQESYSEESSNGTPRSDPLASLYSQEAEAFRRQETLDKQQASTRELMRQFKEVETVKAEQKGSEKELKQLLRKERRRSAVQASQIAQLGEQLREQESRNAVQAGNMEDLLDQLREERLQNEEQAETIGRLERRLEEVLTELNVLRCHLIDTSNFTDNGADNDPHEAGKIEKKHKKHKKHKKKKSDEDKSKEKKCKKKKEKKVLDDDGIGLKSAVQHDREDKLSIRHERPPHRDTSERSGDTEEMSTSSSPFMYPPCLVPS